VRVLPGERIPVDALVVEGRSACDESILTGQPDPQPKAPGDRVHAGSLNGCGQLLLSVVGSGGDTRWIRISRLVQAALARKSLRGEMVDRVMAWFIPGVLLLAAATVGFWAMHGSVEQALLSGLAVLVVACPCSLGLAAPLAMSLGIARAARRGVLLRGGAVLEKLAGLQGVAFDKTGTLTQGRLRMLSLASADATATQVLARARALARARTIPSLRPRGLPAARTAPNGAVAAGTRRRPQRADRRHPAPWIRRLHALARLGDSGPSGAGRHAGRCHPGLCRLGRTGLWTSAAGRHGSPRGRAGDRGPPRPWDDPSVAER
jgi:Cu2+-exporting ATPase